MLPALREFLLAVDRALFDWMIQHRIPLFNAPLWLLSQAANGAVLWLVLALVLTGATRLTWRGALQVALAIGIASTISSGILKPLVDRTRPLAANAADLIGSLPPSTSFPSGHAANSFAAALVLSALLPRAAPAFFALAALVALSRVYIGVHYPFDITAGTIVGLASGALVRAIANRRDTKAGAVL